MPNWCSNSLKIEGKYFPLIFEDDEVDFNIVVPEPEAYKDLDETSENLLYAYIYLSKGRNMSWNEILPSKYWNAFHFCCTDSELVRRITNRAAELDDITKSKYYAIGNRLIENIDKYFYPTWYGWRCANWSTKWNAADTYISSSNGHVCFETAWGPPFEWARKLAESGAEFVLRYEVEGGNKGIIIGHNGKISCRYFD